MVIQGAVSRMMMLGKRAAIRYAVTDMGEEGGAPRWGGATELWAIGAG